MAATLPAIGSAGRKSGSPSIQQHRLPSPPQNKGSAHSSTIYVRNVRKPQGKKERELMLKQQGLRAQQQDLTKRDTAQYRNSYKHNLCLDMLQEGFHRSFAELFALIKKQQAERLQAGPESVLWNQTQLEDQPEKLDMLMQQLVKAETALRRDDHAEVYKAQFMLAKYFQETGDKWLADHFFSACLDTSSSVKTDGGRMAAEGHCNVGIAHEDSGEYLLAAEHFEQFHKLTAERTDWETADGESLHASACQHLSHIYTTIGQQLAEQEDQEQSLDYLNQAYKMAKSTGNKKLEGEASYRLGLAYEKSGDAETALTYLNGYLDQCRDTGDQAGIGLACQAMAKSYQSQGKVEESIRYLDMYVELAEASKEEKAISSACSDLGAIYNSLGKYEKATDYFNRAYQISRTLNDTEAISSSRVLFGVSAAHRMLSGVAHHIQLGSHPCLERLVEWKDNRGDEFHKELPQPSAEEAEPEEQQPGPDESNTDKSNPAAEDAAGDENNNEQAAEEVEETQEDAEQAHQAEDTDKPQA